MEINRIISLVDNSDFTLTTPSLTAAMTLTGRRQPGHGGLSPKIRGYGNGKYE